MKSYGDEIDTNFQGQKKKKKEKKKIHHTNKCLFLIMVDFVVRVTKNIPKHFQKYVNMR